MNLDTTLALAGIVAEAVILGLLIYRRGFKTLPLFSSYLAWSLINDIGQYILARQFPKAQIQIYLVSSIIDTIFMICVLLEVSMSVLKPIRNLLPRWAILAVAVLFAIASSAVWVLVKFPGFDKLSGSYQVIAHLTLTSAIIRIVFFLLLAGGFSQLLSMRLARPRTSRSQPASASMPLPASPPPSSTSTWAPATPLSISNTICWTSSSPQVTSAASGTGSSASPRKSLKDANSRPRCRTSWWPWPAMPGQQDWRCLPKSDSKSDRNRHR